MDLTEKGLGIVKKEQQALFKRREIHENNTTIGIRNFLCTLTKEYQKERLM
mgnify:CR=1 FL=1